MIFSVAEVILDLSRYMVLEPGDIILTGTPEGVALSGRFPYLKDGDIVRLEADRLGSMRQTVRAAQS
jgi:2-keto-4-pentenoate hydratase/2-oxohepta-3-ene-1,7-dioic acid hydratase in catechol pathway